ncbi:MAG TPA: DUF305 domain-containing protein [Vicinamibacterales bacterium]|nr:DUF305 domain-containing protein [Vicinamibacterales bacterium]
MRRFFAIPFAVMLLSSCRSAREQQPVLVQPGAPGQATRTITATRATDTSAIQATATDVQFMQGMIAHHAQALEMTALLASRTNREEMRLLARRIELSQSDEIGMMQRWLTTRGQTVPDMHAHHDHGGALMPGMLTPEEMSRLEAAQGQAFDRLFLESMIRHHDGALTMVNDLFSTEGAGQEPEIYAFASDVDADQRIEIDRMSAMLLEILK